MSIFAFIDIDGTVLNPGDRFSKAIFPENGDRNLQAYRDALDIVQTEELFMQDKPIPGMQDYLRLFPKFVYLTSREDKHRHVTMKWLKMHGFPEAELYMREAGDHRSSAVFKKQQIKMIMSYQSPFTNYILLDDDVTVGEMGRDELGMTWHQPKNGGEVK